MDSNPRGSQHVSHLVLTMADYYGTIAAIRDAGRNGIPVTIAEWRTWAPGLRSRYVTRRLRCPDAADNEAFLSWLMRFGEASPGHVIYPTTDDQVWLFSANRDKLGKYFRLYQPTLRAVHTLLNKKWLYRLCMSLGIPCPKTEFPANHDELVDIAKTHPYPALIKPKAQVSFPSKAKGRLVHSEAELLKTYRQFLRQNPYGKSVSDFEPDIVWPMIQEYYPEAMDHIYDIAGFIDETGEIFLTRAAVKVMQHPRRIGVGVCFEAAEVKDELREHIRRICRSVGYYGIFEVEFIHTNDGRFLLTDFNPRYYNQLALETARGLSAPTLAYYAALGDRERLAEIAARAADWKEESRHAFCHSFQFKVTLAAQRLSGRFTEADIERWRRWYDDRGEACVDAVVDESDRGPVLFDRLNIVRGYVRHPRAFLRQVFLDG
jgi:predicted ATP-grasp superfamily ATP-dependent carboligase